jgi:thiamine biosynthesis lipoprotein
MSPSLAPLAPLAADVVDGEAVRLAVEAMGTRFELIYWGPRAAGEEALAEVVRLDERLSAYQAASDVSWINGHAGQRAVKVEPRTFSLLERCCELSEESDGAFDITVGPLLQAWRTLADTGGLPSAEELANARARVGHRHLILDAQASAIRFARSGMRLDLGAAGKGYAIDAAIAILRAHGVQSALLHGGTSSVHAIGRPPEGTWRIAWQAGHEEKSFVLQDSALSVSAVHGRTSIVDGRRYGHVIDPLVGVPTDHTAAAIVTGPCSLECDALSTALLVLGRDWLPVLHKRFPGYLGDTA